MRQQIKYLFITLFILSLSSCLHSRFIRKEIKHENITIQWYYYSYISNGSPDIIEVYDGSVSEIIFKGSDVVTGISVSNDTIIIKLFEPYRGIIYENLTKDKIFGYITKIDTTATLDDYRKIPDGKKESFFH
jgi:hypothetical protein